jgi:hypothetical protein
VRATFSGGVTTADTVNVSLRDLASNLGVASRVVAAAEVAGPLVVSVDGTAVANAGGDLVRIHFDRPIKLSTGLVPGNYTVSNGGSVSLSGASLSYASATNTITIELSAAGELDPTQPLTVTVDNVLGHSGLAINPPANVGGAVGGDGVAPDFAAAFANYREDFSGAVVDVLFDEDVEVAFALDVLNWSASGGQNVTAVEAMDGKMFRLTLDQILDPGDTLDLFGLPDLAGNLSGAISIPPEL